MVSTDLHAPEESEPSGAPVAFWLQSVPALDGRGIDYLIWDPHGEPRRLTHAEVLEYMPKTARKQAKGDFLFAANELSSEDGHDWWIHWPTNVRDNTESLRQRVQAGQSYLNPSPQEQQVAGDFYKALDVVNRRMRMVANMGFLTVLGGVGLGFVAGVGVGLMMAAIGGSATLGSYLLLRRARRKYEQITAQFDAITDAWMKDSAAQYSPFEQAGQVPL